MSDARRGRAAEALDPALRAAYLRLMDRRFGLRASDHLARALDEAVPALVADTEYGSPQALYEAFAAGSRWDLLEALVGQVTVGETHFYRVAPQIDALQQVVLPELIQRRATQRRLNLWSAGCSTGEEPFTLAILLREQLPAATDWDIQVLATDVSRPALQAARHATYGEWSFRDTPSRVRAHYFTPGGKRWRLADSIRRMVRFAHLNLAADVFPSPGPTGPDLDLIVCRNVTIYFSADATRQLYARFAEALVPEGWLVLGPSDPAPEDCPGLEAVHLPAAVLWRRRVSAGGVWRAAPHAHGAASRGAVRPLPRAPAATGRSARASSHSEPRRARPTQGPSAATRPAPAPGLAQARALAQTGERGRARTAVEQLVAAQPLEGEAHLLLGMLQLDEGEIEPALESLRRATFLDASNALAHFSLGRAYLRVGSAQRARAALTHARRLLAPLPDAEPVPGGDGVAVGELRSAVDAHLNSFVNSGGNSGTGPT